MIRGKRRIMVSVAANVNWNPTLKRLKGLTRRRKKALMDIVLIRFTSDQIILPRRNAEVMMVALRTEGRPSTRKT